MRRLTVHTIHAGRYGTEEKKPVRNLSRPLPKSVQSPLQESENKGNAKLIVNLSVYPETLSKLQHVADRAWWGPWKNTRPFGHR
jgi:hypothetical protein